MIRSTLAKTDFKKGSFSGSQWLALEKVRPLKIYAITWSPESQPSDFSDRSLYTYHYSQYKVFDRMIDNLVTVFLLPEFGTSGNRLHYHGIIAFKTGMSYIKFKDYFKHDHVVIKDITHHDVWYRYVTKQWKHLKNEFPVKIGSLGMFLEWYETKVFRVSQETLVLQEIRSTTERCCNE